MPFVIKNEERNFQFKFFFLVSAVPFFEGFRTFEIKGLLLKGLIMKGTFLEDKLLLYDYSLGYVLAIAMLYDTCTGKNISSERGSMCSTDFNQRPFVQLLYYTVYCATILYCLLCNYTTVYCATIMITD